MHVMKYLFGKATLILFTFITIGVHAQSPASDTEKTYGLDPLLHNGSFYSYHIPSDTKGTPYFNGPDYVQGAVSLRGITYDHLSLKYDVLNQLLIFQYQNADGGAQHIVLSDAWLESFTLGDFHFELFAVQDTLKQIYQVIGAESPHILYAWSIERTLDSQMGASHFVFTKLKKKMYLLIDQTIEEYKNNKRWTSLFAAEKQSLIKKYLVQQHINVKTATDESMAALITYCNSL